MIKKFKYKHDHNLMAHATKVSPDVYEVEWWFADRNQKYDNGGPFQRTLGQIALLVKSGDWIPFQEFPKEADIVDED